MKSLLHWFQEHPLVWVIPIASFGVLLVFTWYLTGEIESAPNVPFTYRIF